jgi:hypothetical protein
MGTTVIWDVTPCSLVRISAKHYGVTIHETFVINHITGNRVLPFSTTNTKAQYCYLLTNSMHINITYQHDEYQGLVLHYLLTNSMHINITYVVKMSMPRRVVVLCGFLRCFYWLTMSVQRVRLTANSSKHPQGGHSQFHFKTGNAMLYIKQLQ